MAGMVGTSGCKRAKVSEYEVVVQEKQPSQEEIVYPSPEGWREMGVGNTSMATFVLPTEDGSHLEASFRKFGDMSGSETFVINMIRTEAKLDRQLEENEVRELMKTVRIDDSFGLIFEVTSLKEVPVYGGKLRIVVAMLHRSGITWFFKYAGNETESKRNEAGFKQWLADMKFEAASRAAGPTMTNNGGGTQSPPPSDNPSWDVPSSWSDAGTSTMVRAKFAISGDGGNATVSISTFPGDVGGLAPNVNRWRSQVGLTAVPESQFGPFVSAYEVDGNQAVLVDLTEKKDGQTQSLLAVWDFRNNNQGGASWFYKIQGDFDAIKNARDDFFSFIDSISY